MNAIVTGGCGFIGFNLVQRLQSDGHSVTVIDNLSSGYKSNHVEGVDYHKSLASTQLSTLWRN